LLNPWNYSRPCNSSRNGNRTSRSLTRLLHYRNPNFWRKKNCSIVAYTQAVAGCGVASVVVVAGFSASFACLNISSRFVFAALVAGDCLALGCAASATILERAVSIMDCTKNSSSRPFEFPALLVRFIWHGGLEDSTDEKKALDHHMRKSEVMLKIRLRTLARCKRTPSGTPGSFKTWSITSRRTWITSNRAPRHDANIIYISLSAQSTTQFQKETANLSSHVHL